MTLFSTGRLTVWALAGGSVQCCVSVAVLVGRVSPQPKKQAQGRGIVAGTGAVQWGGLSSIDIKARVSLEEGLGPGQPTCRQVPAEAMLSAPAAARGRGHGTLGLKKENRLQVGPQTWPPPTPRRHSFRSSFWSPVFTSSARDAACFHPYPLQMIGLKTF